MKLLLLIADRYTSTNDRRASLLVGKQKRCVREKKIAA